MTGGVADDRWSGLVALLGGRGPLVVALSGGVDSALLLRACREARGPEAITAVTVVSELTPPWELEAARTVAVCLGVRHQVVRLALLDDPAVAANDPLRCYHCKRHIMAHLLAAAEALGGADILEGSHAGDKEDLRPGSAAVREAGAASPLRDAGLDKEHIRALALRFELPNADTPAESCLATRIATGVPLTLEALGRVRRAETSLRALGCAVVRVRDHGRLARIQCDAKGLDLLNGEGMQAATAAAMTAAGYCHACLDRLR